NCISVEPIETELGRKRRINQSSCNKDFTCVDGFCPSFVTITGAEPRKLKADIVLADAATLPVPTPAVLTSAYNVLISGIGGLGVTTLAAILAMAAHIEDRAVRTLNRTGLAQKGGAVASHVRIARQTGEMPTAAVPVGETNLHLAYDMIVGASPNVLTRSSSARTVTLLNSHLNPTSAFVRNTAKTYDTPALQDVLRRASRTLETLDARALAETFLGNELYANMIMLGYALQKGWLPVSLDALTKAIVLNGATKKQNLKALALGRVTAASPEKVSAYAESLKKALSPKPVETLDEMITARVQYLTAYQSKTYAQEYQMLVARMRATGHAKLAEAVARGAFAAMMIKDEYEVARLLTDRSFTDQINTVFEGDMTVSYHLAPVFLARKNKATGEPRKMTFGPWLKPVLKFVAALKPLRETPLDVLSLDPLRRAERHFRDEYLAAMAEIAARVTPANLATAMEIAGLPLEARGYGHIKERALETVKTRFAELMQTFRTAPSTASPTLIRRAG
ncbi:MAG: 2-oxoacid:acceptor oxidoreductase family protein, partial [Rhodospirillaceae bacterium]|nr:2-oxoacid:acceptor oxidoreductase family protein [Rhodospirillaceae bacterium]